MKLINQSVEYLPQEDLFKQIELAARTCYKSEDKITDDSAEKMVDGLIKAGHNAMLEHGTVYLKVENSDSLGSLQGFINFRAFYRYTMNLYSIVNTIKENDDFETYYITTNYRVLVENGWLEDLKYQCEPTEHHVKRYTFRLITSISLVRELIRHRAFSFANESTRYVNLNKKGEYLFIKPYWYDDTIERCQEAFIDACNQSIYSYQQLLHDGLPPQAAREVLPLCTKSELIMTGFEDDWKKFLDVRLEGTTGKPHPDMVELAKMIKDELEKAKK